MSHETKFINGVCTETVITLDNGDVSILPDGTGIVNIGTGVPGHLTPTSGELYVQGQSEFDSTVYIDNNLIIAPNYYITSDTNYGSLVLLNTNQTVDCINLTVGSSSRYLLLCEHADKNYNFAHSAQTNPTLFIQSANQSATEWISFTHDQTVGLISAGTGLSLTTSAHGDINLVPNGTGILMVGTGAPAYLTPTSGEIFVQGKSEFNNVQYYLGTSYYLADDIGLSWGTGAAPTRLRMNETSDQLLFALGADLGRQIVFGEFSYASSDYGHATPTNPTLFIHDALDPAGAGATHWLSLAHNQTDGLISSGAGAIKLAAASGQVIVPDGAVGAPGLTFASDTDTGFYWTSTGVFRVAINGVNTALFTSTSFTSKKDIYTDGNIVINTGGTIESTVNGDLSLIPNGTGLVNIGTGVPGHLTPTSGELYVQGKCEIDGTLYTDGALVIGDYGLFLDDKSAVFGDSQDALIVYRTAQTPDTLMIGVSTDSNGLIICEKADMGYDFAHALQTNPTLFIQSANQSATEWISFAHDQTHGRIITGAGIVAIGSGTPASVSSVGDAYVTGILELGSSLLMYSTDALIGWPSSYGSIQWRGSSQTPDCPLLLTGTVSNSWILAEYADRAYDFAHALQTNPTLFIQSANQSATEWISFAHDQTHGRISVGAGAVCIGPDTPAYVSTTGDMFVSNSLEVDSQITAFNIRTENSGVFAGLDPSGLGALRFRNTSQSPDTFTIEVGSLTRHIVICEFADTAYDFAHPQQTNPTLFIQSANQSATEWISFAHNQIDFVEGIGAGSKVTEHVTPVSLADDGTFDLPDVSAGFGTILVDDGEEFATFYWKTDGTVTLVANSSNVVSSNTDTKFCIFDNGTQVRVSNRLGAAKTVMFDYHFTTSP
jgi:hypothetical protein